MTLRKPSFLLSAFVYCFSLFFSSSTFSQSINPKFEISGSGSGFVYQGDLSTTQLGNAKDIKYGVGLFARYYISPIFSLRANYYLGSLRGDDTEFDELWRKKRAYKFNSSLNEFSVMLEADLIGRGKFCSYWSENRHDRRWSIYAFVGAGLSFVNAKRDWSGLDRAWFGKDSVQNIPLDSANSPDKQILVIPAGLGIRYDLSKHTSLFTEIGYRFMFTDNMDGYKYSVYSKKYDGYTTLSVGISYRFNSGEKHNPCNERSKRQDSDGDGIGDSYDSCATIAGKRALHGCPDRDGDGIADRYDECPDDSGLQRWNGCPDKDGDGIVDAKDRCPDMPGLAALNGCPDKDGDNVPDNEDKCPDVPGSVKYQGCPVPDTDGDGFNDEVDLCPKLPSSEDNGCPPVKEELIKQVNVAAKNIFFETAKDELLPKSFTNLDKVVDILRQDESLLADIEGHTDSQGEEAKNLDLSERRAKTVYDYLVSKGISATRLTHKGFGETTPAASNETAKGRALNRRTEIHLRNH